jgi:hypothetical protein
MACSDARGRSPAAYPTTRVLWLLAGCCGAGFGDVTRSYKRGVGVIGRRVQHGTDRRARIPACPHVPALTKGTGSPSSRPPSTGPATTPRSSPTRVTDALGGEPVVSYYVHHEPTFERDEVRRHQTVIVLTPTRLILAHTDEHAGDDLLPEPYTSTSTEAVSLRAVASVVVTRMTTNPTAGPRPARRGGADDRLGRGEPDRPRAGRVQRPPVRGRPRLHRDVLLRRLLAAGLRGRRRHRRGRAGCSRSPRPSPR